MPRHLAHVIGARPNLIKVAPVIRALGEHGVPQWIAHTGQHDDELPSDVTLRDLEIRWDGHAGDRIANEIVDWLALRAAGSAA